ncbi:conserved hypothetical protein [Candidatus Denitrolinea symbiosum]|nr:conserved hypothetical protein [Candidatus Denitrolinea symbiosum]
MENKPIPNKARASKNKNANRNLWIIGSVLVVGIIGVICVIAAVIILNNQVLATATNPHSLITPTIDSRSLQPTGKWKVSTSESEFDNSTTVVLALKAENYIEAWLDTPLPVLILRCKEKKMEVYVN